MKMVNVLDKGYVRLVDTLGSDLTIVNAARVSYAKESLELDDKDRRLINFLAREDHTSPFRHAILQFEVYAPLMVARQWWKYIVGSAHQEGVGDSLNAWNESSRRYITEEPLFYIPEKNQWRSKPENSKQGSGKPIEWELGEKYTKSLMEYIDLGERLYNEALEDGICAEQARLFLPAYGMYVRWYWTASLQSVVHFINQRIQSDAQKEIQEYAKAILILAKESFPVSLEAISI
ncbi:FAD-dependent thymidylate synthase [Clostridium sp. Cult1]|uniref:FAD-dependent thymidylate synthase n=1 Tax=Clostridium sp. Cult1 TaxID=2079002 RepID=UPI001F006035|nr:FAD-dependent thymidylate synthase [Clostridium sp. Cult1]MCF6461835.1 thymidylate synthase (FAD) [Clostridium sp. Cult1]